MAWIAGLTVLIVGIGWLIRSNLWTLRVIRATPQQIHEIVGDDLAWRPPDPTGPVITCTAIAQELGSDRLQAPRFERMTDAQILLKAPEMAAVRRETDRFEALIAGKTLDSSHRSEKIESLSYVSRAYISQFEFDLIDHKPQEAVDRLAKIAAMIRFLSSELSGYEGRFAWYQCTLMLDIAAEYVAKRPGLPPEVLRSMYSVIDPAPRIDPGLVPDLKTSLAREIEEWRNPTEETLSKRISPDPYLGVAYAAGEFDVPKTLRQAVAVYREAIRNSELAWNRQDWSAALNTLRQAKQLPPAPNIPETAAAPVKLWSKIWYEQQIKQIPNALGVASLSELGAPNNQVSLSFHHRVRIEQARLLIALLLYRATYGVYPPSLASLGRLKLPGPLPIDLYASGAWRYDAKRQMFWSVGANGKDDGGTFIRGGWADDVVYKLP